MPIDVLTYNFNVLNRTLSEVIMSKGNHTAADKAIILYGLIEALNEMDPLENSEEALLAFTSVLSQARSMAQSLHKELEQQLE